LLVIKTGSCNLYCFSVLLNWDVKVKLSQWLAFSYYFGCYFQWKKMGSCNEVIRLPNFFDHSRSLTVKIKKMGWRRNELLSSWFVVLDGSFCIEPYTHFHVRFWIF
jgi:hypothetical protein